MEVDACNFAAALEGDPDDSQVANMKMQLEGRFRFLWGIYRAHSEVCAIAMYLLLRHSARLLCIAIALVISSLCLSAHYAPYDAVALHVPAPAAMCCVHFDLGLSRMSCLCLYCLCLVLGWRLILLRGIKTVLSKCFQTWLACRVRMTSSFLRWKHVRRCTMCRTPTRWTISRRSSFSKTWTR